MPEENKKEYPFQSCPTQVPQSRNSLSKQTESRRRVCETGDDIATESHLGWICSMQTENHTSTDGRRRVVASVAPATNCLRRAPAEQ